MKIWFKVKVRVRRVVVMVKVRISLQEINVSQCSVFEVMKTHGCCNLGEELSCSRGHLQIGRLINLRCSAHTRTIHDAKNNIFSPKMSNLNTKENQRMHSTYGMFCHLLL